MPQHQNKCPFTKTAIEDAYGAEVSLFLHCHLRGYDRQGEGKYPDNGNNSFSSMHGDAMFNMPY